MITETAVYRRLKQSHGTTAKNIHYCNPSNRLKHISMATPLKICPIVLTTTINIEVAEKTVKTNNSGTYHSPFKTIRQLQQAVKLIKIN